MVTQMKDRRELREILYVCAQCKAEDRPRFYENEAPPVVINCFKCHAGQGKTIDEQIMNGIGMFPVRPPKKAA